MQPAFAIRNFMNETFSCSKKKFVAPPGRKEGKKGGKKEQRKEGKR